MYGPSLFISDFSLGILYMLAVSSLATYGILLAGYPNLNKSAVMLFDTYFNIYLCVFRCIIFYGLILLFLSYCDLDFIKEFYLCEGKTEEINYLKSLFSVIIFKVKVNTPVKYIQIRKVHMTKFLKSINNSYISDSNAIKSLHSSFIKELYRDRNAPVKPFNRESILATCYNCLDKSIRSEFLKQWGSKSCIYLIEYKHDPLIYYIGRTTLFKRRLNNHLKADSGNKLHMFLKLVGWEHFNVSIIEECTLDMQGARENYYLQEYLPLLNSVFSSSFTEHAINVTLKNKLEALKANISLPSSKSIPLYIYDIDDKGINKEYIFFNSMLEASIALGINIASINQYRNTSIPYRGKLIYTSPIIDFNQVFESSKQNTPAGLANKVVAVEVWCYDAKTLELIKGSPFESIRKASKALGISRNVIDYFIDTGKAEGIKGTYLYTRPITDKEIKNLILASENLQLGNKIKVWAYNAKTFELINNAPFPSILETANFFNVNYRTITRHLDTKLATMQNKFWVYFFKKEVDSKLKIELTKDKPAVAKYARTQIWVYKVNTNGELTLIPNQPFRTKRETIKKIGIRIGVLNEYLDTSKVYKDMLFFTYPYHK